MSEIVNKIAQSGLVTIDPADYLPTEAQVVVFDLKPLLFRELILKEKDFREALGTMDWEEYRDKIVALTCSADAIIPMWAYMLVVSYLEGIASEVFFGDAADATSRAALSAIEQLSPDRYRDRKIVIKGCGDRVVPPAVYIALMKKLRPTAQSVMFGEPCSTVPVYKRKREANPGS